MKRLLYILFVAVAVLCAGCSRDDARKSILKVYNWADYIDESLLSEFEKWYFEQTGEEVEVVYQLFDINEIMLAKIERGKEDFDVVCPSEYIIERMLKNDLLLPINKDFGNTPNYLNNVSPFIHDVFDKIDGGGKNANDYAVGYMWGTTGFLYNTKYVTREEADTWNSLWNKKFDKKLLIKDAFRDVYSPLLIFANQERIAKGEVTIDELMHDASDESIAVVEALLKKAKPFVAGWEADFGKEQMTKGLAWINMSWSGDAQWAIDEAAEIGVELEYAIPQTGSTVWFDAWVIPKYAKNIKAARYFINFMCMPENAIRNMDYIGYVSTIGGEEVLESMSDSEEFEPIDVSYFFGPEADSVCVNPVLYPDSKVIERCGMMHDCGTEDLLRMWSRVKGDSASVWTYTLICLVFAGLIGAVIYKYTRKSHRRRKYSKRKTSRR